MQRTDFNDAFLGSKVQKLKVMEKEGQLPTGAQGQGGGGAKTVAY